MVLMSLCEKSALDICTRTTERVREYLNGNSLSMTALQRLYQLSKPLRARTPDYCFYHQVRV